MTNNHKVILAMARLVLEKAELAAMGPEDLVEHPVD